jgi:hypothetical protein
MVASVSPLALQPVLPVGDVGTGECIDKSSSNASATSGSSSVSSGPINDTANDIIVAQQMRVSEGTRMVNECGNSAVDITKA